MSIFWSMDVPLSVNKRSCASLMTYKSLTDGRAFANDNVEKAKFIQEVVKRKSGEHSSDINEGIASAVRNMSTISDADLVSQIENLQKEIKTKDDELDKIHSLFKSTSKKLEEMEKINKESRSSKDELKESETEQIKSIKQEMDEPTTSVKTEKAWNDNQNQSEVFEEVQKERNILKAQLCKMVNISEVLSKLKTRADEADAMEQEICQLKRELQRCGQGAAGDNFPVKRIESTCKQCDNSIDELSRVESILESEQKKNIETEAERNFLRERCRAIDVTEAELIFYKTKYEEAECKVAKLREILVRSEGSDKENRELKQRLVSVESQLKESERHAEELINTVERLDMNLKEREIYIESITRRVQQEHESNTLRKSPDSNVVPTGKVQSIVQKLTVETLPTNCKCGFDNCQCLNVAKRDISVSKLGTLRSPKMSNDSMDEGNTVVKNLEPSPVQSGGNVEKLDTSEMYSEYDGLQREISCEEVRLLRSQNAALDEELKRLKCDMKEMHEVMNKVGEQRNSNTCLEQELAEMNNAQSQEFKMRESIYLSSVTEKEEELNQLRKVYEDLQQKFCEERNKSEVLEKNLAAACDELKKLRPLESIEECCKVLKKKLSLAEADGEERSQKLEKLQGSYNEFCQENKQMKKQIVELKIELDEQRKYAKKLADQLCLRRCIKEKPIVQQEPRDNRETLRKCIKDLKQNYDALKVEKMELIRFYEKKLKTLENDMYNLKFSCNESEKICHRFHASTGDSEDPLLSKAVKCGLNSLQRVELIDLHNRIRCAMIKLRNSPRLDLKIPIDYYTKVADEIRNKYNLSDAFPVMDPDDTPVKDIDMSSSKTLPSLFRSSRKSSKAAKTKPRARSIESGTDKLSRCVTFCKQQSKSGSK